MENEDKIKQRAYTIWEEKGRPEGEHNAHWNQAKRELNSDTNTPSSETPAGKKTSAKPTGEADMLEFPSKNVKSAKKKA